MAVTGSGDRGISWEIWLWIWLWIKSSTPRGNLRFAHPAEMWPQHSRLMVSVTRWNALRWAEPQLLDLETEIRVAACYCWCGRLAIRHR